MNGIFAKKKYSDMKYKKKIYLIKKRTHLMSPLFFEQN